MRGDQFKPIEAPYMKLWRERLAAPQGGKRSKFAEKELEKVVAQIKKGALPKKKKRPLAD
jgi:hypothetical protein